MAYDEGLAERIRDITRDDDAISERKMFGGLTFMRHGHMFVGILGDSLMARVGPDAYAAALAQPGVRVMDFTGRPMKGYVLVAPEFIAEDEALAQWVKDCADFVDTLPAK